MILQKKRNIKLMTVGLSGWTLQCWRKIIETCFKNSQTPAGITAPWRAWNKSSARCQLLLCAREHRAGARQRNLTCPHEVCDFCFPRAKPVWEDLPHHAAQHSCLFLSQLEGLLGQVPPTGDLHCKEWRGSTALCGEGSYWDTLGSKFCTRPWSNEL